jgi:hypothetical protein
LPGAEVHVPAGNDRHRWLHPVRLAAAAARNSTASHSISRPETEEAPPAHPATPPASRPDEAASLANPDESSKPFTLEVHIFVRIEGSAKPETLGHPVELSVRQRYNHH